MNVWYRPPRTPPCTRRMMQSRISLLAAAELCSCAEQGDTPRHTQIAVTPGHKVRPGSCWSIAQVLALLKAFRAVFGTWTMVAADIPNMRQTHAMTLTGHAEQAVEVYHTDAATTTMTKSSCHGIQHPAQSLRACNKCTSLDRNGTSSDTNSCPETVIHLVPWSSVRTEQPK